MQQLLQKVTVGLKENARVCAFAAVLPELVADGLAAAFTVEFCRELRKRKCSNAAGLQYDHAAFAMLA